MIFVMYNPSVKPYARAESPPAKASFATRSIETSRLDGLNFWSGHDPTDPSGSAVPELYIASAHVNFKPQSFFEVGSYTLPTVYS